MDEIIVFKVVERKLIFVRHDGDEALDLLTAALVTVVVDAPAVFEFHYITSLYRRYYDRNRCHNERENT